MSLGLQSCSTISPSPPQPYLRLELPWPWSALIPAPAEITAEITMAGADCSKWEEMPSSKDGQNFPGHFRLKFDFVFGLGLVCFMNCAGLD